MKSTSLVMSGLIIRVYALLRHDVLLFFFFFFSSRRRHTRFDCDWSSDVCSSDLSRHGTRHVGHLRSRLRGLLDAEKNKQRERNAMERTVETVWQERPRATLRDRKSVV